MNKLAQNINVWLGDESLLSKVNQVVVNKPDHSFNVNNIPIRLDESISLYNYIKDILLQAIASGDFEKLPASSQNTLFSQVQSLYQNRTNANSFIQNLQSLYYHLSISRLENILTDYSTFKKALSDISNLRKGYAPTLKGLENTKQKFDSISQYLRQSEEKAEQLDTLFQEINDKIDNAETNLDNSNQYINQIKTLLQTSENAKKEIVAFKENIDSYKEEIDAKTVEASKIITEFGDQHTKVNKLIRDAETALMLKSSEGISAALSNQYDAEDNSRKKKPWIIAALVFIIFAIVGIIPFIINIGILNLPTDGVNAIIARIVFIGLSVSAATFCANQYVKQKSIADDYGFKLVLAKSIMAFTQELKRHDQNKAVEYMKGVLDEINRSPISKHKSDGLSNKQIGQFQRIIELITKSGSS